VLTFDQELRQMPGIRVPLANISQVEMADQIHPSPPANSEEGAISKLIEECYRRVTPKELSEVQLLGLEPNEPKEQLQSLQRAGRVAKDLPLNFFMTALIRHNRR
jgi:hypothetical protein